MSIFQDLQRKKICQDFRYNLCCCIYTDLLGCIVKCPKILIFYLSRSHSCWTMSAVLSSTYLLLSHPQFTFWNMWMHKIWKQESGSDP